MKRAVKKISTVLIGRSLKEFYNHIVDYVVYPLVLIKLGYWTGFIVMVVVTGLENFAMLLLYFKMKIDWLGYDYVDSIKKWAETKKGIKKWLGYSIKKSDFLIFLLLSTLRDAFETTAYFRHNFALKRQKEISIFLGSLVLGNIYWSLGVELLINSWLRKIIE